jgi:PAS domain S-box-containing protein
MKSGPPTPPPSDAPDELQATARLAAIVESSADAMIGKTLVGVITSWNAGAERMYGYTADEIMGRNVSILVPPELSDELSTILGRVVDGDGVDHVETQRLRKNGAIFDAAVTISPIRTPAGEIVGASTVTQDITDRKRAESEVRDLQERLHQAQRLESIGQLAGGIAHDFNNLLAGIMNYSALVADGLAELTSRLGLDHDETATTLKQDIAEITTVATRAARLTHQLLIFSRRKALKLEVLDLNAVVIDMEKLLRRTIGEAIDLETVLAPRLPHTKGDRSRLEQVLMNLAVNARDAMNDGGTLRIETASYEADDGDSRRYGIGPGHYLCLAFSDSGHGMSAGVAARAFEPFFTTKDKSEGGGMGLATVYGIVSDSGGHVLIDSRRDHGTKVEIILPTTDEAATAVHEPRPERALTSRGETILLVEDEEMVREPTRRILAHSGYVVLAASGVDEALRIAGEHPGEIELLLTDVVMPGQSGNDLAARLAKTTPRTKVLFMSGYTSDVIGVRALSEEGVNLIEKPFAARDLLRTVREVLDGS